MVSRVCTNLRFGLGFGVLELGVWGLGFRV